MRYALIEMNEAQAIFIGLTTAFPEDTQVTFVLCVKSSARLLHSIPRHQMRPELCFTRDHAMSHCARDRTLIAFLCLRHRAFQLVSDVIAKMHLSGSDSNNSPCCPIYFKFTAKVEATVQVGLNMRGKRIGRLMRVMLILARRTYSEFFC